MPAIHCLFQRRAPVGASFCQKENRSGLPHKLQSLFRKLAADRQDACASIQKQAKRQARDAQRCNLFRLVSSGDQHRSVKRAPPNGEFSGIHRIRVQQNARAAASALCLHPEPLQENLRAAQSLATRGARR